MPFLVRVKVKHADKNNTLVGSLEHAEELLGVTKEDRKLKVEWCNITDHFYKTTDDYIRQII